MFEHDVLAGSPCPYKGQIQSAMDCDQKEESLIRENDAMDCKEENIKIEHLEPLKQEEEQESGVYTSEK